jgi:hypothetical protein
MTPLDEYLAKCTPIQPLITGPTLTEEQAIKWLVDESFKAGRQMIKTHLRDDIVRFIILAQILDGHGYDMVWYKGRRVVGAHKKGTLTNNNKEASHGDQRANGCAI